jgi:hypothetical protein
MNYLDSGFDPFMERSIGADEQMGTLESMSTMVSSGDINFDASQISGSLGDRIQVGGNNVIIDGGNRRIVINDGVHDRVLLGYQSGGF